MSSKPFKTYLEQIKKLTEEKGLMVSDVDSAIEILKKESYFALINGYKENFKKRDDKTHYCETATFNDIYALYKFDESLRILFLKYILIIERHIKSLISYEFCCRFGDEQCQYLDARNYNYIPKNIESINHFLSILSNSYKKSSAYKYIRHYSETHKNVPLWVLMNVLTFGQISKMFQYMIDSVQSAVSKNFSNLRQNELGKMLAFITLFRNVCAHNERLFNYTVRAQIPVKYIHTHMNCKENGKHDLFAVVICFKYLLDDEDFDGFVADLQAILDKYKTESQTLTKSELVKCMGFPSNWRRILKAPKEKPLTHQDIIGGIKY